MMRTCTNCKNRYFRSWDGVESCMWYDIAECEGDVRMQEEAEKCGRYEEGNSECLIEERHCPSATAGDYGPGNPWDAPGCSISMFI